MILVISKMKYPNKTKLEYNKNISYANRGMDLENMINLTNQYYLDTDRAVIYKKPTPIGINKVKYNPTVIIEKAYFKDHSTLDYNGIYRGKYIEFDVKETKNKTSFTLSNIKTHQIIHLKKIIDHGGICFLIIKMNDTVFLLPGEELIQFIEINERKSIPNSYFVTNAHLVKYSYNPVLNYLDIIDKIYKEVL